MAFYKILLLITIIQQFNTNNKIKQNKTQISDVTDLLLPMPINITKGDNTFSLGKFCTFELSLLYKNNKQANEIVRIYDRIINKRHYSSQPYYGRNFKNENTNCKYEVKINVSNMEMKKFSLDYQPDYELYALKIDLNKDSNSINILLDSFYLNGLVRGLETFSQLLYNTKESSRVELYNLPLFIEDKPAYNYRGVMIDTSRHYISLDKIKEILDGMMYSKLNVLHWHLTDDEYFGFGTSQFSFPQNYYYYSKKEMREIIEYAFIRGITIIPEIDTPSHSKSWNILENSVVITKPEYGTLDPSKNLTYEITEKILRETMDLFSPNSGEILHLGGDEVLSTMWTSDEIKEFMKLHKLETIPQLENYYFNVIRSLLPTDRSYIYWISNSASQHYEVYDKPQSILMYWGESNKLNSYLDKFPDLTIKRNLIITSGDFLYLDCGTGNKYGDGTWCGDYKTWKKIYNTPLFKNYKNFQVLGSQVTLFGELADDNSVVGKIFPRACSLSERLWSETSTNIKSLFIRLLNHNKRLNDRNIHSISFTTQLCENNPNECLDSIQ